MRSVFADFVHAFTDVVISDPSEEHILDAGRPLLEKLVAGDSWLPDAYAVPSEERYQQYLLHCDPAERFSVVSFVWLPGQRTPVHDHCTWGLAGVLRGEEWSQRYDIVEDASGHGLRSVGDPVVASRGSVDAVSATIGDIHEVVNTSSSLTISIHVYGRNIGRIRRHTYDAAGRSHGFVSGYVQTPYAQLWA